MCLASARQAKYSAADLRVYRGALAKHNTADAAQAVVELGQEEIAPGQTRWPELARFIGTVQVLPGAARVRRDPAQLPAVRGQRPPGLPGAVRADKPWNLRDLDAQRPGNAAQSCRRQAVQVVARLP